MPGEAATRDDDGAAALEKLAAQVEGPDYAARLVTGPSRRPFLRVTSRHAAVLCEDIYAAHGWYWHSWAERIALVGDVARAAERIHQVLRAENRDQ